MTLSGIATINFRGNSTQAWRHETFDLYCDWISPVSWAYGKEPPDGDALVFEAEQWTQHASLNAIYDIGHSIEAGFAVDSCEPLLFGSTFHGLTVGVGVRDTDAFLVKVGFTTTVLGKITLAPLPN